MINVVLVDDNNDFLKEMERQIKKFFAQHKYRCKIYTFNEYDDNFFKLTNKYLENTICLLDIETEKENGIDAARKIRQYNQDLDIIFLTVHDTDEYKNKIVTSNIKSMGFIYKGNIKNEFEGKMEEFLNNIKLNDNISFQDGTSSYSLCIKDICYITTSKTEKKTIIKTISSEFHTSLPLKVIEKLLLEKATYFVKIHRSYMINILQVTYLNIAKKQIIFGNGDTIESISRPFKEALALKWKEYHFSKEESSYTK